MLNNFTPLSPNPPPFPGDSYVRKIDGSFDPEDQISPSNTASGLSIVIPQVNPRPAQTKKNRSHDG